MMQLSTKLRGSWLLVSRIDLTRSGARHAEPMLGDDPVALLIYDDTGHFSAQFMKRSRSSATGHGAVAAAGTNNTMARDGYDAYFGTYSVNDKTGEVTQTLLGSLSPANVGMTLTRKMRVRGRKLLIVLDTTADDGTPVTRTLTWKRL